MNINYEEKYLKYKEKYFMLRTQTTQYGGTYPSRDVVEGLQNI